MKLPTLLQAAIIVLPAIAVAAIEIYARHAERRAVIGRPKDRRQFRTPKDVDLLGEIPTHDE